MKLSTKFSAAVVLLLLVVLGGTAALLIRHQRRAVHAEALQRAQLVLSFGESCREYTRNTLSPKVRAAVPPGTIIFEADSATAVARATASRPAWPSTRGRPPVRTQRTKSSSSRVS